MEIKVGILKSKLITDNPELLEDLIDKYSFKVKGSQYTKAYKKKRWDGKKRFISKTGIFRSGLIHSILYDLYQLKIYPTLEETEAIPIITELLPVGDLKYRDYQVELIKIPIMKRRGVIKAPTGAGKTLIMAGIWHNLGQPKSVFLFNTKQLARQTYEFFLAQGFEDVGICTGEGHIPARTMFCTYQSINKIVETHLEDTTALFVDECHEFCNGETTLTIIRSFPNAIFRFGFTATPPEEKISLHDLMGALGGIIEATTTKELVKEGHLSKPIVQILRLKNKYDEDRRMSYLDIYDKFIVNNYTRNHMIKSIVDHVKTNNQKARILILVRNLEHWRRLAKILPDAFVLEGKDNLDKRYENIDLFLNSKQTTVLIGTKILQTGINIEEISHLVNARGMESKIATLQALGRALRKVEGQEKVYIYDFFDDRRYLRKHSSARMRHYKREGHEVKLI